MTERLEVLTEMNKSLKAKVFDMDDELKRHKKQMKTLQATIEAQNELSVKFNKL